MASWLKRWRAPQSNGVPRDPVPRGLQLHEYTVEPLTPYEVDARGPRRIVDNRTFLLGLDHLYREAMKTHERTELLSCARAVAGVLALAPAGVPVEGYYSESPALAEYFRLMRALQGTPREHEPRVAHLPEFKRLQEVTSAPLYGRQSGSEFLVPAGQDPLSQALTELPEWSVPALVERAAEAAERFDDFSLVGLAARMRDAVVIAATRESVVLYAAVPRVASARPAAPKHSWEVDQHLAHQSKRFIDTFNALFDEGLPDPVPENAALYYAAGHESDITWRCVRIAFDSSSPANHYHWAIRRGPAGGLEVDEFWDTRVWTTDMYREKHGMSRGLSAPSGPKWLNSSPFDDTAAGPPAGESR